MKKITLLLAISMITVQSFAQNDVSAGVKAGIISSGMRGDAPQNLTNLLEFTNGNIKTQNHTGFFMGGYVNIPFENGFSIEPGIYFTQKGYDLKGNLGIKGADLLGVSAKAVLTSNYLDVPLYLKATTGSFSIFAGPQISYLLNSDLTTTAGVLGINLLNKKIDATTAFHKWDAAVAGGISYKFVNGLNLSVSYDYGFLKADANRNVNAWNHAIKAAIGLEF